MRISVRGTGPLASLVLLLLGLAMPAGAQQTTGKVQGRVTDVGGQPLAGVQVIVVGTGLGNLTDQQGFYFINNVPAGVQDIQAQFIGYQTTTVQGQRITAGYTTTVDFKLAQQAVALKAITVQGERNPLVPRDKTVSGSIVTGDIVRQLPVDNANAVIALQPGVISYGGQFVIRGGRPGEASVYVDGVLVRNFDRGEQGNVSVDLSGLEEVNVLTGGFGAQYGQAQSGVINYVTRTGGTRTSGAFNFGTDEWAPNSERWGWSVLHANIDGPLVKNLLTYQIALGAQGMRDRSPQFTDIAGPEGIPVQQHYFRPTGMQALAGGDSAMSYEEITGLGPRRPYNNGDVYNATAGLRFSPSSYTKITVTGVAGRSQGLNFNSGYQFRPWSFGAYRNTSDLARVGLEQILFQSANSQAVLRINAAYQNDQHRSGVRADTTGLEPSGPDFLGFRFSNYKLMFENVTPEMFLTRVNSIRAGASALPFYPAYTLDCGGHPCTKAEATDRFNGVNGTDTPYGILGPSPFRTTGFGDGLYYSGEKTYSLDASLDLQAGRFNRIGAGVQYYKKNVGHISVSNYNTTFQDVYAVKPTIGAGYLTDRLDLGEMVLDLGLRLDYYSSDAKYPAAPGVVYPFEPDASTLQYCESPPPAGQITCTPKLIGQDNLWNLSPRLGVAFPISDATNFRLSYGHFFQLPSFVNLYDGINTDLNSTNTNQLYGRPIPAMRTVQFEVGVTHLFNPTTVLDVTAYNKNKQADATYRIQNFNLPPSYGGPTDMRVLTNLDFGAAKGVNVRLTRRYGQFFTAILSYSFLDSKDTGSDPTSYVYTFGRFTDPVTGAALSPAQAMQNTDFDINHQFTIESTANLGKDVLSGTGWNPLLRNTNLSLTFLAHSGLPWTTSSSVGASGTGGSGARFTELQNSSRMPWFSNVDGRFTRGFTLAGSRLAAYLEVRNILNTRNITNVYGYTGSPTNPGAPAVLTAELWNGTPSGPLDVGTGTASEQLQKQRQQQMLAVYGLADADPSTLSVAEQKNIGLLQYVNTLGLPGNYSAPRRWRLGIEWTF